METEVDFYSEAFTPFLPEDAQVNPECYGAELAWWLCRKLADKGLHTSYPNFEDWGWFLEYVAGDDEYWLCCGNVAGEKNRWRVFLQPKAKGLFGRKPAPVSVAEPLLSSLRAVLDEAPEISHVEWHAA